MLCLSQFREPKNYQISLQLSMSQLIKISMQFFHLLVGPLVCWSIMLLLFGVLGATYALFITIS